jgi:hypothetical protein
VSGLIGTEVPRKGLRVRVPCPPHARKHHLKRNVSGGVSVIDYGPQHQSTCGMVFNESVNRGPSFGPPSWRDTAIVCDESRGKIWATRLAKTDSGYVASTQLLACLQMLTVDACVAPNGDLVVACHSGPPDWGTGPQGTGKLFRVRMSDPDVPRPIATWASGPSEMQITFDRPLDPESMRGLAESVRLEFGFLATIHKCKLKKWLDRFDLLTCVLRFSATEGNR